MAFDAGTDNDRLRSLEAQMRTMRDNMDRLTAKVAATRAALCAKERSDGSFVIDFEALVEKLGVESCLELRAVIDQRWSVSGAPGEKPRVRVRADTATG